MKIALLAVAVALALSGLIYKNSRSNQPLAPVKEVAEIVHKVVYVSPVSIDYLRSQKYDSAAPAVEYKLVDGSNYSRNIVSYDSNGNKIFGLLTVPKSEVPVGGFKAIIFIHGYIPPTTYATTERYVAYVDYLASRDYVVFKIDLRGHGNSEGIPRGSYFSSGYTIDALNAVSSLQKFEKVDPTKIGMWGHSMAGNMTLRAMEVSDQVKAGVIWSGAVYSYEDFGKYGLSDSSYHPPQTEPKPATSSEESADQNTREDSDEIQRMRANYEEVDFSNKFWKSISLTQNLKYLGGRKVQLHHAINDDVVNVGYARDLKAAFEASGLTIEEYEYVGGGHNIEAPYFDQAIQRTAEFFDKNL